VLRAQFSKNTHGVGTAVLCEGTGNNLEGTGKCLEGPLLGTFNFGGNFTKTASDLHFEGTTTGGKVGVDDNITGDAKSIVQVTLNFVEDILGGTTEQDRASIGINALSEE